MQLPSIFSPSKIKNIISIVVIFLFAVTACNDKEKQPGVISTSIDEKIFEKTKIKQLVNKLLNVPIPERYHLVSEFIKVNPVTPIFDGNEVVSLYWFGKTKSVSVTGDIRYAWSAADRMNYVLCGDSTFFYKTYKLPSDTRIDYLLNIDTVLTIDPRNAVTTPSGFGIHSQLSMPLFNPDKIRELNSDVPNGSLDALTLNSKIMPNNPRQIKVYKPAGYDSLTQLASLYVNDGYKALDYCQFVNVLDNLIAEKKIKPIIVVFIKYEEDDSDYFLNITDDYEYFLTKELVPFIERQYKTSQKPGDRGISGISAGGSISLLTAITQSNYFTKAAGQSSTITENLLNAVDNIKTHNKETENLKLYFDVGRYDLLSGAVDQLSFLYLNQMLNKKLNAANVNHHFKIYNDGHQWANWRERTDDILIYLFGL